MNYKDKQEWIEAVMASDLTPATKVYAFGIYKHMYGLKSDSFPGAKALEEATGQHRSKFFRYNQALKVAGFLEVTPRRGTSNEYRLTEVTPVGRKSQTLPTEGVTPNGSKGYAQEDEGLRPEGVGVTPTGSTNTTKNTTNNTTKEEAPVLADARTAPSASFKSEGTEVEWELDTSLNGQTQDAASEDKTARGLRPEGVTPDTSEGDTTMNHLICMPVKEREQLEKLAGIYGATEEQVLEAAALLRTTMLPGWDAREKHEAALKKVGVEIDEW